MSDRPGSERSLPSLGEATPLGVGVGVVDDFDDPRGLGRVRAADGVRYPFHCTAVADGTRSIQAGTVVSYRVGPGRLGRWEAFDLRAVTQVD